MKYKALRPERAKEVLNAVRAGEIARDDSFETRGTGELLDEGIIRAIERRLHEIKGSFPETLRQRSPEGGAFETQACVEVHRALPFDAEMLADYDFWTWIAVVHFREIVDWRHGSKGRHALPANFGLGKREENLLYRMWIRADVGFSEDQDDPYTLAQRGDQDFWRSHVIRPGYGRSRPLVRALVAFQFPEASKGRPSLRIPEIRDLAKRLSRLHPSLMFECLDQTSARRLIEEEAEAARMAVSKGRSNDDH